jgi:hypothetical protein
LVGIGVVEAIIGAWNYGREYTGAATCLIAEARHPERALWPATVEAAEPVLRVPR